MMSYGDGEEGTGTGTGDCSATDDPSSGGEMGGSGEGSGWGSGEGSDGVSTISDGKSALS